jgi:Na+/melibiose symporter-like transporter
MNWPRALVIWFLIVVAESIHGTIRQFYISPIVGDLRSRQIGVLIGSAIIFVIAWACAGWIGARSFGGQFRVGLLWVVLIVIFEFSLGILLGYTRERMLSDYNVAKGGCMAFGLLFMLFAPALAARARGLG